MPTGPQRHSHGLMVAAKFDLIQSLWGVLTVSKHSKPHQAEQLDVKTPIKAEEKPGPIPAGSPPVWMRCWHIQMQKSNSYIRAAIVPTYGAPHGCGLHHRLAMEKRSTWWVHRLCGEGLIWGALKVSTDTIRLIWFDITGLIDSWHDTIMLQFLQLPSILRFRLESLAVTRTVWETADYQTQQRSLSQMAMKHAAAACLCNFQSEDILISEQLCRISQGIHALVSHAICK